MRSFWNTLFVLSLCAAGAGCGRTEKGGEPTGSGIEVPTGGDSSSGGSPGTAGATGTGGAPETAGATGTGGTPETAGATGTGGAPEAGGAAGAGGAVGSGGSISSGGASGSGGSTGVGGATATSDGGLPVKLDSGAGTTLGVSCGSVCNGTWCRSSGTSISQICGPSTSGGLSAPCIGTATGMYCTRSCTSDSDCAPAKRTMRCLVTCPKSIAAAGMCWSESDYDFMVGRVCGTVNKDAGADATPDTVAIGGEDTGSGRVADGGSDVTPSPTAAIKFCHGLSSGGSPVTLTLDVGGNKISASTSNCQPAASCLAIPAKAGTPISLSNGLLTLFSGTIDLVAGRESLVRATLDSNRRVTLESKRANGICSGGTGTTGTSAKFCNFLQRNDTDILLTLNIAGTTISAMSGTCTPIGSCTPIRSGSSLSMELLDGTFAIASGTYPSVNPGANMVFSAEIDDTDDSPTVFGSPYSSGICSPASGATAPDRPVAFRLLQAPSSPQDIGQSGLGVMSLVRDRDRPAAASGTYRSIAGLAR